MRYIALSCMVLGGLASPVASAADNISTAKQFADQYEVFAQKLDTKFKASVADGREFYTKKHSVKGKDISCSSCHTDNPTQKGKHAESGKEIQPLSPNTNPKRFAVLNKSEEGFVKHCNDILARNCTPQEKANYVTYLLSAK